jgi:hypothetical protein
MPNITAGQPTGINIPAGQVLTLVGSSNVTGMLRIFSPDRTSRSQTNVMPGASSYGPYPSDVNCELQCWTGDVNYAAAASAVPSATAGLPQGVDSDFAAAVVGAAGFMPQFGSNALHRWMGAFSSGDTSNATYSMKWMVEADFDQVGFLILHREATAASGWSLVAAATETASTATQATTFHPVVGGTAYNAIRGATDTYGWESYTVPDIPSGGTLTLPKFSLVAPLALSSVPRADGGIGRLLMARVHKNGGAGEPKSFRFSAKFDNMRTPNAANRGRIIQVGSVGSDAVGTLGTSLTLGSQVPALFPIIRYRRPVVTVAAVGDSITENFAETTEGLTNYMFRACADVSTESVPVIPQNYGLSSQGGTVYLPHFKLVASQSPPSIAFFFPFSPNDIATPTLRSIQDERARAADFVDYCRTYRIYPVLCTSPPNNGYAQTPDDFRKAVNAMVLSAAGSWGVTACDFSALGDGATPERYVSGLNADSTHPDEDGIELMAAAVRTVLRAVVPRIAR